MYLNLSSKIVLFFSSLISGLGVLSGNFIFEETSVFTIKQQLIDRKIIILDVEGNSDDDLWLVLAQKYRENGVTKSKEEKVFKSQQQNPEFLSEEDWNNLAKGQLGFDKDFELAEAIKRTCKESISKKYKPELFDKVNNWCKLYLLDNSRELLKIQRENGNCRFLMSGLANNSSSDKKSTSKEENELFVWEDSPTQRALIRMLLKDLSYAKNYSSSEDSNSDTKEKWAYNIIEQCGKKKNQILKLSTGTIIGKKYWQVTPNK